MEATRMNGKRKIGLNHLLNQLSDFISLRGKNKELKEINSYWGYSDLSGFDRYMKEMEKSHNQAESKRFVLVMIQFANLDRIFQLLTVHKQKEVVEGLLLEIKQSFPAGKMFHLSQDKVLLYLNGAKKDWAYEKINQYILSHKEPFLLFDTPFVVVHRAAVVEEEGNYNAQELLFQLHRTMGIALKKERDVSCYQPEVTASLDRYFVTLVDICKGIKNNEFYLVFQPKVEGKTFALDGVEVLLRWNNPLYEQVPISEVIQIAEEMGLIHYMSNWIVEQVFLQQRSLQRQGIFIKTAVNMSISDMDNPNMVLKVRSCLQKYNLNPSFLEFELTEYSILKNESSVFRALKEYQAMGILISLDDYGTGHNSLNYLLKKSFRFDAIKIDKSFIAEIQEKSMKALIKGIIDAAHGISCKVIAEGVETTIQAAVLVEMGCDTLQGYYFSKPLNGEELTLALTVSDTFF